MYSIDILAKKYPKRYGSFLAIIGVLILTPDTMVMRFSNLDKWSLMGWRGILMGITLFILWNFFIKCEKRKELKSLFSFQGIIFIFAFAINSICFTLGIIETSVMVVLTAVATMPVFAAILSSVFMRESQGFLGWITIILAMIGVYIVVSDGNNAVGHPEGSVVLGGFFGILTAFGLALIFTLSRRYPELGVVPAGGIGAFISGLVGFSLSSIDYIFNAPIWTILCMGVLILPLSFIFLFIAPRYTSSSVVSLVMLLEMVIGPFWVWIGVGESPSIVMIYGAALVVFAITFHIVRTQFLQQN